MAPAPDPITVMLWRPLPHGLKALLPEKNRPS